MTAGEYTFTIPTLLWALPLMLAAIFGGVWLMNRTWCPFADRILKAWFTEKLTRLGVSPEEIEERWEKLIEEGRQRWP